MPNFCLHDLLFLNVTKLSVIQCYATLKSVSNRTVGAENGVRGDIFISHEKKNLIRKCVYISLLDHKTY